MSPIDSHTKQWAKDAAISGSTAALLSAAALTLRSKSDEDSFAGGLNGPSQWIWGRRAARTRRASLRHTGVGYLIHHSMSVFWALIFERVCDLCCSVTGASTGIGRELALLAAGEGFEVRLRFCVRSATQQQKGDRNHEHREEWRSNHPADHRRGDSLHDL